MIHSVQTGNIIKLLSFSVSKIAGINLRDFELDEDVLELVLGGSTLIILDIRRTSRQPLKCDQVHNLLVDILFFSHKYAGMETKEVV